MTMTKKYKILAKFVKDNISNYSLQYDIKSKPLKNKIIQVETKLIYSDKSENKKKSYFEMIFVTIIRLDDSLDNKSDLGKLILCDLQNEIYPDMEKTFLNVLHGSGYSDLKFNKKIDFEELYKKNQVSKVEF